MDEEILNALNNESVMSEDLQKRLTNIIEKYQQLSDEDKDEFKKGAFDVLKKTLTDLSASSILPTWLVPYQSYILFFFAVSMVFFLLGTVFLAFSSDICDTCRFYRRRNDASAMIKSNQQPRNCTIFRSIVASCIVSPREKL